jgi:hypothetical protein
MQKSNSQISNIEMLNMEMFKSLFKMSKLCEKLIFTHLNLIFKMLAFIFKSTFPALTLFNISLSKKN